MSHTPRVAIVEAGFGGLGLAEQLDHVIKADLFSVFSAAGGKLAFDDLSGVPI